MKTMMKRRDCKDQNSECSSDKRSFVNSMGMFDFFKGLGLLIVILGHTSSIYSFQNVSANNSMTLLISGIFQSIGAALMPAFFVVSGYGFRTGKVLKCIKKQSELLLRPYCVVMIAAALTHLYLHYSIFKYWKGALGETWRLLRGFLLALPKEVEYRGELFWGCGVAWYIVALFWGWIILNMITKWLPDKYEGLGVVVIVLLGWLLGQKQFILFCLPQGFISVGYLYIGYRLKKDKLFARPLSWKFWLMLILLSLISILSSFCLGQSDNMAKSIWNLGPISIILDGCLGACLLNLAVRVGSYKKTLIHVLEIVGRHSLLVFGVHTVEMQAVPWYLWAEKWSGMPAAGCVLQFLLRSFLIGIICVIIRQRKRIGKVVRDYMGRYLKDT